MKIQDDDVEINLHSKTPIISSSLAHKYEFYLTGEIQEPEMYLEWFHTIRSANDNDVVVIYINSPGGFASTAIQFLSVLDDCDADILIQVEGECYSAATLIFMKAGVFAIAPHSQFMFHNYSGGAIGKGGEIKEKVSHQTKWSETLLKDVYKHFFNESEIQQILDGKDFWMDGEEVIKRMNYRLETFKKEFEDKEKEEMKKTKAKPTSKEIKVSKKK
ncbi:MAG: ATP-dependent Clp protease proteolytic subunit [Vulcanibacillus sp.]